MKNKLLLLALALSLTGGMAYAQNVVNITPVPKTMTTAQSTLTLPQQISLYCPLPDSLRTEAERFATSLSQSTGLQVSLSDDANALVGISANNSLGLEAYKLDITAQGINIEARTTAGLFYAFQTLKKLLPAHVALGQYATAPAEGYTLPCLSITDEPRFGYRGFMLDAARHFFSVEEVKKILDLMSIYKLNRFHWHLSDDQGWRAEIKKWPRLTSVGSIAPNSYQWDWTQGGYYTNRPYGPYYYTQEEMRDVVAYARERHIEILPEIDMPGHFVAAMTAYPEFSCTPDGLHQNWMPWGVSSDVLNVANPQAVQFAKDIISELMDIFPYPYIHIGGDECPTTAWQQNAECQQKMQDEGMTNARQLQSHFIKEMADFAATRGHKLFLWNESITESNADVDLIRSTGATIMCWTGPEAAAQKAASLGLQNVMTPYFYYYINRRQKQDDSWMKVAGDGNDDLQRTYNYQPIQSNVSTTLQPYYTGVQGTFWTEHVADSTLLEYLALPRLMAIAETGWTPENKKNFTSFCQRMAQDTVMFKLGNYRYSPHYLTGTSTQTDKVMPKFSTADKSYYYRLVTRSTGDRANKCIELLAEGSPLISQYSGKGAKAGVLWTNAQAAEGDDNYDNQFWALEEDPDRAGYFALVCRAQPEGSVIPTTTTSNTARFSYDATQKHYDFKITADRYGQDGDYYYYSISTDALGSWLLNAAASGQGYSVNLWNVPADGGNSCDWQLRPDFTDSSQQLGTLLAEANQLAGIPTYADTPLPGQAGEAQVAALKELLAQSTDNMSQEETTQYLTQLQTAIGNCYASIGGLKEGQTYQLSNSVEGYEGIALDDKGQNNLTYATTSYAADAWVAEQVTDNGKGGQIFRLKNAATGRYISQLSSSLTSRVGYAVTMGTTPANLTSTFSTTYYDYNLGINGSYLFPVSTEYLTLQGQVAAGTDKSNGNQSGNSVRLQGNAWTMRPVAVVTYRCSDTDGKLLGTYTQSVSQGTDFTATAPQIDNYALVSYNDSQQEAPQFSAISEAQTVDVTYRRVRFAVNTECIDANGGIIQREQITCPVDSALTLTAPEIPYYQLKGDETSLSLTPTSDTTLVFRYTTEAYSGVRQLAEPVLKPVSGQHYVLYNTASNTERRGYLNVSPDNKLIMASGRIENQTPYYTWTIEEKNGRYQFGNVGSGLYIPVLSSGTDITATSRPDAFSLTAGQQTNTLRMQGTNGLWWNGNVGKFTGYSGGHDFTIYRYYTAPYFSVTIHQVDTTGRALVPSSTKFYAAGSACTADTLSKAGYVYLRTEGNLSQLSPLSANVEITLIYEPVNTGISHISDATAPKGIYNLSGRRQKRAAQGIYIIDGQKTFVRKP